LKSCIEDADLTLPVPSCPGWNLGQMLRPLGAVDEEVAVNAIDEWMELGSLPMHFEVHLWMRELLGPGRTFHLPATDTAPEAAAEWLIDLTGDDIVWRRVHEKAAVAVRGPLIDLLLVIYKRRSARGEGIEILGDVQFLDFWLEQISLG
jgi:hypothetical protein